jgi:glyoxylase-like metal-dependent hydrolase (beta-lactamase superfamily II)
MRKAYTARLEDDHGLLGIGMKPSFAIGQRALLVPTKHGNVMWDCSALIDDASVREIKARGGLSAIAISHCHYYTTMLEWSAAFGDVPIYLHESNRKWVQRESKAIATGATTGSPSHRPQPSTASLAISPAAWCCTGQMAPTAKACCSPATSCR